MQKEECIRIDSDKDVIIEFGHEAAQDFRFGFCNSKKLKYCWIDHTFYQTYHLVLVLLVPVCAPF